jgi:hypothetical protein
VSDAHPERSLRLSAAHLRMLREESAIAEEVIQARGYRTVADGSELRALGFDLAQCRPGLLLPLWTPDGQNPVCVLRPDAPRSFDEKEKPRLPDGTYPQRVLKYEYPKGEKMRLDCPPACRPQISDPAVPLWITEGQKKADALASHGFCALALLGVWNWRGRNDLGGLTALADWDSIALNGREVRIAFDSDVMTNPQIKLALRRLTAFLHNRGATVGTVYLPPGAGGRRQGVDDYFAAGNGAADLECLVGAPRPEPQPPPPIVRLLDREPETIRRPLALAKGSAFAVTWLWAEVEHTGGYNKRGEIVLYTSPRKCTELRLFVVREDGCILGEGPQSSPDVRPLHELSIEVHLPEIPPADKLWSRQGVSTYRSGSRPAPADVFRRVVDVVDRFIDFNRSIAEQRTTAELIGCFVMASYFLPAFTVTGFLWPNGDRGSGKTQLLTVCCELGYLGQVILAGGSYASLRDLADYGAMLAFDDAENLSDFKKTDPDKRALLLAGNRRGNTVPVKELTSDRVWRTRYVNTFCPRLFSATRLPDAILASRTIIVPLIRTPDRFRANADPLNHDLWPHDRRALLDDLWALALAHLSAMPAYEQRVNDSATLTGRNLEPWRASLAVALWLDEHGVSGLWQRMEALSVAYQSERTDLEASDLTVLVLLALAASCADRADRADPSNCANPAGESVKWIVETSEITAAAKRIATETDSTLSADQIDSRRVGMTLNKMRIRRAPRMSGRGPRRWEVTLADLERGSLAYGLALPEKLCAKNAPTSPEVGAAGAVGAVGAVAEETPCTPTGVGPVNPSRIPLNDLAHGDYLERNKLRVVGGTPYPDGRTFRPTIYLAEDDTVTRRGEEGDTALPLAAEARPGTLDRKPVEAAAVAE